jgi:L-alanine-DL-glutamate epimerase-like enolase superfamily enzyme
MKIEAVDFFYLSMPEVTTDADGSQDALLVRVSAGGHVGWGECEASPLVSIAAFVCPMSHGACRPVAASVLGQPLDDPQDIARIAATVEYDSMDLLQAAHTFSGIEMAMWDLLGQAAGAPVYSLLGYPKAFSKTPYASMLFGHTAQETLERCRDARARGFQAVKCGWGPFGRGPVGEDRDHLMAAREAIGAEGILLVDAGQIWGEDLAAAEARIAALEEARATWLEEPFHGGAYSAYSALAQKSRQVRIAGGEAAHNYHMARQLIDYGKVGFIQIDCGRIGGIGPAKRVADYAAARGVTYVNHTFTSHLALSASLQPFAGLAEHRICEYPAAPKSVAWDLCANHLMPDDAGELRIPDAPGLGITVDTKAIKRYLVDTEITVHGKTLYRTPELA